MLTAEQSVVIISIQLVLCSGMELADKKSILVYGLELRAEEHGEYELKQEGVVLLDSQRLLGTRHLVNTNEHVLACREMDERRLGLGGHRHEPDIREAFDRSLVELVVDRRIAGSGLEVGIVGI